MVLSLTPHTLPWREPLDLAAQLGLTRSGDFQEKIPGAFNKDPSWALLYSALPGENSYLACEPESTIRADDFSALEKALSQPASQWDNAWFGYLGYGLKDCLEKLPADTPGNITMPALWMCRYRKIFCFDHASQKLTLWSDSGPIHIPDAPVANADASFSVTELHSNMSRQEYLDIVRETIGRIHAGDFYQANITRKFFGTLSHAPDPLALFSELCRISPAPYSALLKCDDAYILSSSPESFLSVDATGHATTRPIKGSAPRAPEAAKDEALRASLIRSAKDKAENLMIVDLMRNDLARHCVQGSVEVKRLFGIESFANVHHMVSTISGTRHPDASTLELVKGCFPPGSMTGTPKKAAMEWCTEKEKVARGIYSGAIGFLGGDGSAELSVVIRTLLLKDRFFEFQVGGGIVADSDPAAEWNETLIKAKGIATLLGVDMADLKAS